MRDLENSASTRHFHSIYKFFQLVEKKKKNYSTWVMELLPRPPRKRAKTRHRQDDSTEEEVKKDLELGLTSNIPGLPQKFLYAKNQINRVRV